MTSKLRPPLDEGDTVEMAITLSKDYNSVKVGVTTTVRSGEDPEDTFQRAYDVCVEQGEAIISEIAG
jgi:hypothetical protein